MFDQIGVVVDEEANRRRAMSTLITGLLLGATGSFFFAVGAWTAVAPTSEPVVEETALAVLLEPAPDTPPDLPPAPVRKGGGKSSQKGTPEAKPAPQEALSPAPLTPVRTAPVQDKVVKGTETGTGEAETEVDGPPGTGQPHGTGDGDGGGSVRHFHHTELTVRRRIEPMHPEAGGGQQLCIARILISDMGRADRVDISGCEPAYEAATRAALSKWRWNKPRANGKPTAATTSYRIVFKPLK